MAPRALTDALHDRFRFERELGRGAMGLVFLARDLRHDRAVALKVIRAEVSSVVGAERFGREIHLAARLQHPNIVPVYESGECQGSLYYVMPHVEGESLRDCLRREPQLSLEEALRIAREVADALGYAHAQGVVHRDIKPENVLLAAGHALVADFGIACAITAAGGERLTETGLVLGTPAYMSPEQSTGSLALDGRSDLYSLACVLYEMLAGEPPYTGPSSQAIIAKRLAEPTPHLRTLREEIPESVEAVVLKALAKAPADRFATVTDFAQALAQPSDAAMPSGGSRRATQAGRRFPRAATLGLGVAVSLGALFAGRKSHEGGEAIPTRLAVLPFENLGDSADGYFADGVTEAIRGKLTSVPELQVIASNSSNQYRHTTKPPREIGRELGVNYLLVGTVRWVREPGRQSRIQVSPELVEAASAADKWQQPFDAALTDVFQVQADIASRVAQALGVALSGSARAALAGRPTQNLAAYDSLLRGDQLVIAEGRLDKEAFQKAAAAYRAAVRLDSTFGLAWARLAWAESYVYNDGPETDSVAAIAKDAADRALALAPDLGQTWDAIALMRDGIYFDWLPAITALERARALAPHDVDILTQLAVHLAGFLGRFDEALALCDEAARLDPRSPLVARRYAAVLNEAGRFRAADSVGSVALKIAPDNFALLHFVKEARLRQGDVAGARALLREALAHVPARRLVAHTSVWLLDDSLQALALSLPPEAFDEDRAVGLMAIARLNWDEGRYDAARATAAMARPLLKQQLEQRPTDTERLQDLMEAYAFLRRCEDAWRVRDRLYIVWRNLPARAKRRNLAEDHLAISVRCGEYADAVAWADTVIRVGIGTRAWFRVDPALAPLRGRPDFERVLAGK